MCIFLWIERKRQHCGHIYWSKIVHFSFFNPLITGLGEPVASSCLCSLAYKDVAQLPSFSCLLAIQCLIQTPWSGCPSPFFLSTFPCRAKELCKCSWVSLFLVTWFDRHQHKMINMKTCLPRWLSCGKRSSMWTHRAKKKCYGQCNCIVYVLVIVYVVCAWA